MDTNIEKQVEHLFVEQGLSAMEIERKLGVSPFVTRRLMLKNGWVPPIDFSLLEEPTDDVPPPPPLFVNSAFKRNHPVGSRWLYKDGYVVMPVILENGKRKWIKEHRYIMEKHLNRKLSPQEHVHHKNGVKHDNRLSNLVIIEQSAHHRMENFLLGKWSKNYDKCVSCGTTENAHHSHGYCDICYNNVYRANPNKKVRKYAWSMDYPCCTRCHTTEVRHVSKGLCARCREQSRPKRDRRKR